MKKFEIIKNLTFENASEIHLFCYYDDLVTALEGIFTPILAMRIVRSLPSSYHFSYIPIE